MKCSEAPLPEHPVDGTTFECPACGYMATFVILDDGQPGEWVAT